MVTRLVTEALGSNFPRWDTMRWDHHSFSEPVQLRQDTVATYMVYRT